MSVAQQTQTPDPRVPIWHEILQSDTKSWVLFEHGTCVILMKPEDDLAKQATDILAKYGPVHVGTPAGDFNIIELEPPINGWVVTGHHPDVLVYLAPTDVEEEEPSDLLVGMLGRGNRDQDGKELKIVHIEDNRGKGE